MTDPADVPASEVHDASGGPEAVEGTDDGLLPRLALIEAQPLAQRAGAYAALHSELRSRLEDSDTAKDHQWQTPHASTPR